MMALTGVFQDQRPSIQGSGASFVFDATISGTHQRQWEWTAEPVEDGSTFSDHRWERPVPLTIVVTVSSAQALPPDRTAHIKAWNRLEALAGAEPAELFTIVTARRQHDNMGIVSISEPEGATIGDQMLATIVAEPKVLTQTGVAQNLAIAAQDGGLAEVDVGTQGFASP
jgi:hypothetical protein